MTSAFKIADERHDARKNQWRSTFEIPPRGRETVCGYAREMDAILHALRGVLAAKRARVPFEIAREVQGGIFLHGAPGCGKTHLVAAAAGTLRVPMLVVQPSHILCEYAGPTGHVLSSLFDAGMEIARERGGAVLFFDEIQAYGKRTPKMEGWEVLLSNILKCLDRASAAPDGERLAFVAATNDREACEPALLSRLSTQLEVGPPDADARREYLAQAFAGAAAAGMVRGELDLDAAVRASAGLTLRQVAQALDAVNARTLAPAVGEPAPIDQAMVEAALAARAPARRGVPAGDPAFA